jgi:large subunit ribosomal protein L21
MYAIVDIAGQQFRVEKDQKIFVHRLAEEEGKKVTFEKVMLIDHDGKVSVGAPLLEGAKVTATVIEHLKGDKLIVFKKKRRKGYQVSNGHRQYLTQIQIEKITAKASKKVEAKSEEQQEAENAE